MVALDEIIFGRIARREDGIAFLEACERSESLKEKQPG
jgi:hypothetical protein